MYGLSRFSGDCEVHSDYLCRLLNQTKMKIIQSKIVPVFMDISAFYESNSDRLVTLYINPHKDIEERIALLDPKVKVFFYAIYARIKPDLIPGIYQTNLDSLSKLSDDPNVIENLTKGVALPILQDLMQQLEAYSSENYIFPSMIDVIANY